MTPKLVKNLQSAVGDEYVITGDRKTRSFRRGIRFGGGKVLAVARPGTLLEMWRVLSICVEADVIVIMQAANTGLTGGSTPFGEGYDRDIVIINAMRINRIDRIRDNAQVIALPGATLDQLEKDLRPFGREPHSVIGSSCIGASITGGVCNNSGGMLVQRGPAFTQLALYAQRGKDGKLTLVNHLGVKLGNDPETILARLDGGKYQPSDISTAADLWGSDHEYCDHVRDVDAKTPARFNADPRRLFEASGSAGKLAIFALRVDTFAAQPDERMFYIGTNDARELSEIRRHILQNFTTLPTSGEFLTKDGYELTQKYGKDLFLFIKLLGTDRVPLLFKMKSWVDGLTERFGLGGVVSDHVMQMAMRILPQHLPKRMNDFAARYDYHLMLKMGGAGIEEARAYLSAHFPSTHGDVFECTPKECTSAELHRFAFGGANGRYRAVHKKEVEDMLALDVAFPRNTENFLPDLPESVKQALVHNNTFGHFFCHVFHMDYMLKKGSDPVAIKEQLLDWLEGHDAEYPAEHNVGHLYKAKPKLVDFYHELDPTNTFNAGIGKTSKIRNWE